MEWVRGNKIWGKWFLKNISTSARMGVGKPTKIVHKKSWRRPGYEADTYKMQIIRLLLRQMAQFRKGLLEWFLDFCNFRQMPHLLT
jgi:hypothetical protein